MFAQQPLGNRLTYNSTALNCIRRECNYTACDYLRFIFVSTSLYAASVAGAAVTLRGNLRSTFKRDNYLRPDWFRVIAAAGVCEARKWAEMTLLPPPPSPLLLLGSDPAPFGPLGYYAGAADGWIDVLLTRFWRGGWNHKSQTPCCSDPVIKRLLINSTAEPGVTFNPPLGIAPP